MTHTPATRGALVDRLLSYADKHPATWAADEAKALLREAAAAIARPADGWLPIESAPHAIRDGVEVTATDISIGGLSFRVVNGGMIPPGFAILCNAEGWAAFTRGEQPDECNAAVLRLSETTPPASDTAASVQQGEG